MSRFGGTPMDISRMISLKIENLSFDTQAEDLKRIFSRYGDVTDVYIPREHNTKKSRGFAFVRYDSQREADKAIDNMDQRKVDGRMLKVSVAKYGPPTALVASLKNRGKNGDRNRDRSRSRRRSYSRDRRNDRFDRRSRSPISRHSVRSYQRPRSRTPIDDYGSRDDGRYAKNDSYENDRRNRRDDYRERRKYSSDDRRW